MKIAKIANFKRNLSAFLALVEKEGETIEIHRGNVPIAQVVAIPPQRKNHTVLDCGAGSVVFHGSVTEPLMSAEDWEMLEEDGTQA